MAGLTPNLSTPPRSTDPTVMYWYGDCAPGNISASQLQTCNGAFIYFFFLKKEKGGEAKLKKKKKSNTNGEKTGAGPLIVRGLIYRAKAEVCPLM